MAPHKHIIAALLVALLHPKFCPAAETLNASVVCQRGEGIFVKQRGAESGRIIAKKGSYPRWSPDGTKIAFVREKEIAIASSDGADVEVLAAADSPRALAFHPQGGALFFTDGSEVKSVDLNSKTITTRLRGQKLRELDISSDGRFLAGTEKGWPGRGFTAKVYDLESGKTVFEKHGCGPSFSPDDTLLTVLAGDHRSIEFFDWKKGKKHGSVPAPKGEKIDNPFWSNDPNFIVSNREGKREDALSSDIKANKTSPLTANGDCTRADLYVGSLR